MPSPDIRETVYRADSSVGQDMDTVVRFMAFGQQNIRADNQSRG